MRVWLALLVVCELSNAAMAAETIERQEHVVSGSAKGPWRRLFFDATVVEESEGVQRIFHAVEKFAGNPVMKKEHEWEGTTSCNGIGLPRDRASFRAALRASSIRA